MREGHSVHLTSLRDSDAQVLFDWLHHRDHRLNSGFFEFVTPVAHERWFEKVLASTDGLSLAVRPSDDSHELWGLAQLLNLHRVHRHAELRVKLAPDRVGQGVGTLAVRKLCRHGFDDLNLERIYLYVMADNKRALAVYKKTGFQSEGLMRRHAYIDGEYKDIAVLGLLRREFIGE